MSIGAQDNISGGSFEVVVEDPFAPSTALVGQRAASGSLPVVLSGPVEQGSAPWSVSQSGSWTAGRTWVLASGTDSVSCIQGTSPWLTSRNWVLDASGDSVAATQSGTWTVQQGSAPWSVSQSGVWTTGRTWALASGTDSIACIQSTSPWLTSRNWTLAASGDSVSAAQSGTWTVQQGSAPWSVSQSGAWTTGRTWTLASGTDSISCVQSTSPWVSNISQFGGNNVATGTGTSGVGIPRVTVSNDSNILATQSGTWTVQQGTPPWQVVGNVADAATDSGNSVKIGGVFDATLPTYTNGQRGHIELDSNGRTIVTNVPLDGSKTTYSAAINALVAAATPTDVFTITGSSTKTIRVTRISFSASQNTSASRDILLLKRSTANSGGTSTTLTSVPHDSANAASTAVIRAYTANPTLGTLVAAIRVMKIQLLATNVTNPNDKFVWDFGVRPAQAIVLRGTSEVLSVNLNAITSNNNLLDIDIEWTEE